MALTSTSKQSRSSKGSKILQYYTQELVQITFSSSITPKHKHLKESVAGRIQCMNSKQSGAWNKQLSLRQAQHRTRCGNNSNHVTRKKCTFWICKDSSPRSQANRLRASSHQNKKVSTWRSLIASLDWQPSQMHSMKNRHTLTQPWAWLATIREHSMHQVSQLTFRRKQPMAMQVQWDPMSSQKDNASGSSMNNRSAWAKRWMPWQQGTRKLRQRFKAWNWTMVPLPPQTPVTPVSIGSNRTKINKMQSKMHKERSGFRSSSVVQITDTTPAISMKTATTKCWTKVTHGLPAQHPPTQREATMHLLTCFITGLRGPQDNIFHSHPTEGVGGMFSWVCRVVVEWWCVPCD